MRSCCPQCFESGLAYAGRNWPNVRDGWCNWQQILNISKYYFLTGTRKVLSRRTQTYHTSDSKIFYEQRKNQALPLFANTVHIKEEQLENSRMSSASNPIAKMWFHVDIRKHLQEAGSVMFEHTGGNVHTSSFTDRASTAPVTVGKG